MADRKISGLPPGGTLTGTELVEMVQSSSSLRTTTQAIANLVPPGNYPPTPVPDLQTWLQAGVDSGEGGVWLWGPQILSTPIVVNFTSANNYMSMLFDFQGARFMPSPTWAAGQDMFTFICPDTNLTQVSVQNLQIKNLNVRGDNDVIRIVRYGLVISAKLQQKGAFYGGVLSNCQFNNCATSGCKLYGGVFELTIEGMVSIDHVHDGLEICNPDPATGGVISAIHIKGGDLRSNGKGSTNGYGINLTSDVAFTQPVNVYVHGCNFIVNSSAAIKAPAGITYIDACHFENNCFLSETLGSIWTQFGFGVWVNRCDVEYLVSIGPGKYLCDITNTSFNWIYASSAISNSGAEILATLGSTGTLYLDGWTGGYTFDGSSTWDIRTPSYTNVNYLGTATGTGEAHVIAAGPSGNGHPGCSIKALRKGDSYTWQAPNAANTTTSVTVSIAGVATVGLVKRVSTALAANDILANQMCEGIYNGTAMRLKYPTVP